jgi:hypothetical protein
MFSDAKTMSKPVVRFYFDFDGTLTSLPGASLVFTPFYKSCVGNYNDIYAKKYNKKYKPSDFANLHLSADVILEKLHGQNNNPNAIDFEMRPACVSLLQYLLSDNNNFTADIHIVSKNIGEYITAVLMHHGFTENELSKLTIHDIVADKQIVVADIEKVSKKRPASVLAFDDNESDLTSMWVGCLNANYDDENIHIFLITPEGLCQYQYSNEITAHDWHNLPSNILPVLENILHQRFENNNTCRP